MIGLRKGVVELCVHSDDWCLIAEGYIDRIRSSIGVDVIDIAHVGSTSIIGIPAKPIIDLAMVVADGSDRSRICEVLGGLGFRFRKRELSGKELYLKATGDVRECLLHLMPEGHPDWDRYITFRDRLNSDQVLREEYARLKQKLSEDYPEEPKRYVAGKTIFVSEITGNDDPSGERRYMEGLALLGDSPGDAAGLLLDSAFSGNINALSYLIDSWHDGSMAVPDGVDYEIALWHAFRSGVAASSSYLEELYMSGSGRYAHHSVHDFNWEVGVLIDDGIIDMKDRMAVYPMKL